MAGVLQQDDWRADLASILPNLFIRPGRGPCVPECGPGWAGVVDRLRVRIAALEDRESFRFESIGSCDGALRIRWEATHPIFIAEQDTNWTQRSREELSH